jgi:photosystem II stability/assembly factor-like uncharacterized protein
MRSTVGLDFNVVTLDSLGNAWVGGSIWLMQGLLLRVGREGVVVFTPPRIGVIHDLKFTSPLSGWSVADYDYVYGTDDGGLTWKKSLHHDAARFSKIFFVDALNGWVIGSKGIVYHTANGGATWRRQHTGTELDLSDITFIDEFCGWAVGGKAEPGSNYRWNSAMLMTTNGGENWRVVQTAPALRRITFTNTGSGWGLTVGDDVFHTEDGGINWSLQIRGDGRFLPAISFLNDREGWVGGDDDIGHTTDGGRTWTFKNLRERWRIEALAFADRLQGWAITAGEPPMVLHTVDGGQSWDAIPDDWREEVLNRVYKEKFGHPRPNSWGKRP